MDETRPAPDDLDLVNKAREEMQRCAARRDRVLAHPHIAVKLTQPPMRFKHPDQWSGYIPPFTRFGSNAVRDHLIQICKEVITAEERAAGDHIDTPTTPGTISRGQLSKLHIEFKARKWDRAHYLEECATILGHTIDSTTDLSYNEAGQVLSALLQPPGGNT